MKHPDSGLQVPWPIETVTLGLDSSATQDRLQIAEHFLTLQYVAMRETNVSFENIRAFTSALMKVHGDAGLVQLKATLGAMHDGSIDEAHMTQQALNAVNQEDDAIKRRLLLLLAKACTHRGTKPLPAGQIVLHVLSGYEFYRNTRNIGWMVGARTRRTQMSNADSLHLLYQGNFGVIGQKRL